MRHLGVEQQGVETVRRIFHRGDRRVSTRGHHRKPRWCNRHEITVARPDPKLLRQGAKQRTRPLEPYPGVAIFALRRACHTPPERLGHHLHAITDAKNRRSQSKDGGVAPRRALIRHARRPARQNDADRLTRLDPVGRGVERNNLGVDGQLTKTPRDELRVLRPKIQHKDGLMGHRPQAGVGIGL